MSILHHFCHFNFNSNSRIFYNITSSSLPLFRRYCSEMGPYTKEYLESKIQNQLKATHVDIEDISDGCGAKFNAIIVSPEFDGKTLLQRHRMVNDVLKEEMQTIHAFSQKTLTPEQWETQKPP